MNMPINNNPNQDPNNSEFNQNSQNSQVPPGLGDARFKQKYSNSRQFNPNPQNQEQRYQPISSSGLEEEDIDRNRKEGSKEMSWKSILVNIAVSLVVVMVMNSFVMPLVGKKTYQADITRLETDLVAIREVDSGLLTRVSTMETNGIADAKVINEKQDANINNLLDKISTLESTINQQSETANSVQTELSGLRSEIETLKSNIANLNLAPLEERLTAIEAIINGKEDSSVVLDGKLTVDIKWDDDNIYLDADNRTIILYNVKMYITNGLSKTIDEVELEIDPGFDIDFDGRGCNDIYLEIDSSNYNRTYHESSFYSSFDNVKIKKLDINPGDREKINCELRLILIEPLVLGIGEDIEDYIDVDIEPDIEITDYEFD